MQSFMYLVLKSLAVLTAGLTAAGIAYYCLCLLGNFLVPARLPANAACVALRSASFDSETSARNRSGNVRELPQSLPAGIRGIRDHFGVSDPDDPAVALVRKLIAEFPSHKIQLLICPEILGTNVKVSNLLQMARVARYEHFFVNDSDIRVPADYLRRVLAPFADTNVGMVTCLYRGVASNTLGSRLESIGTSTDFCPAVLAARLLQGVRFGLGSTMAFSRKALDAIGGFEPLLDYLAETTN